MNTITMTEAPKVNTVQIKAKTAKWFSTEGSTLKPQHLTIDEVRYFKNDKQEQEKVFFDKAWGKKGGWFKTNNQTFLYADSISEWRNTGEKISL